jgi:pyrroloquinoline quinone biosynthesis protein D
MTTVSLDLLPALRRGIKRKFDAVRGEHVLLGPERVIQLDDIANAIAELCDGQHSISKISSILAERYAAPIEQVEPDVLAFIQELLDKNLVTS